VHGTLAVLGLLYGSARRQRELWSSTAAVHIAASRQFGIAAAHQGRLRESKPEVPPIFRLTGCVRPKAVIHHIKLRAGKRPFAVIVKLSLWAALRLLAEILMQLATLKHRLLPGSELFRVSCWLRLTEHELKNLILRFATREHQSRARSGGVFYWRRRRLGAVRSTSVAAASRQIMRSSNRSMDVRERRVLEHSLVRIS
jgi:hypothetical protein